MPIRIVILLLNRIMHNTRTIYVTNDYHWDIMCLVSTIYLMLSIDKESKRFVVQGNQTREDIEALVLSKLEDSSS